MVANEIYIKKYRWTLRIFYAVNHYHADEILDELSDIGCPPQIMQRVHENLLKSEMDSGFTYSNKHTRHTVMVIGIFSSRPQFLNSLQHELRHMVDDITDTIGLNPNGEPVAYLTGDINQLLAADVQMFMCDCTHCHSGKEERIY